MKTVLRLRKELLQIVLLVLPFVCVAVWWDKFPPVVATHWGMSGQPNGWMPKLPGLLFVPVLNVVLALVLAFLPRFDPRARAASEQASAGYRRALWVSRYALTAFLSLLALAMMAVAAGRSVNITTVIFYATLVLFAVLGNVMGNLRPNYFVGIRTPWTLEDAETWRATHRVAGRWMVFGALPLLAMGPFVNARVQLDLLLVFVLAFALGSVGYSFWFYKRRRVGV